MTTRNLPLLYGATLMLSASLLFFVQPMIAKMLLPLLGGTPAVWNTCMVFFQAMLLAGYAYAHFAATRLSARDQVACQLVLLLGGAAFLPIGVSGTAALGVPGGQNPSVWLIVQLLLMAGWPFFVIASTSPLLQRWFSNTPHASAHDPYFLYSASNVGSLVALLTYPALVEPSLAVSAQSFAWMIGYSVLVVLTLVCALAVWRTNGAVSGTKIETETAPGTVVSDARPGAAPSIVQKLRWVLLAFIPSSLMLGATAHITTDLASIPLLWIVPLTLYLLSFILVFARRQLPRAISFNRIFPAALIPLGFALLTEATQPVVVLIALHMIVLFSAAMVCHGRLASERPGTEHLTEFYLLLSLGGALGGIFNGLIAPLVFPTVIEYPIALVLACVALPLRTVPRRHSAAWDFALPILVGGLTVGLALVVATAEIQNGTVRNLIVFGFPLVLSYVFVDRPVRFALGLAAVLIGGATLGWVTRHTVRVERNFFGVARVISNPTRTYRWLVHGNTVHGRQHTDPNRACEPLSYYHPEGPVGAVFDAFTPHRGFARVGVIGLGTGSMICYSAPREHWTFYEIDPAVIQIATDTNCFTYLAKCGGANWDVALGDARLRLQDVADGEFDLLLLDAFSSDSIPVHLLTREAFALYLRKLGPRGYMAIHISNRYLELEPVLGDMAGHLRLACRSFDDDDNRVPGKDSAHWVVMARTPADLGVLMRSARWLAVKPRAQPEIWTDDFSNVFGAFKWR